MSERCPHCGGSKCLALPLLVLGTTEPRLIPAHFVAHVCRHAKPSPLLRPPISDEEIATLFGRTK